jgi:hypothetical protein
MHKDYLPLINALAQRSISAYFQNDDQLVISKQAGPALPFAGNSFWVTRKGQGWYLCTWGPVCYEVPDTADVTALSADFVARGRCAQTFVPVDLIEAYGLRQLDDEEFGQFHTEFEGPRVPE